MDFKNIYLNYKDRNGNLNTVSSGEVKSTKFFPYYYINERKYIFKPLSKTKPFSTPLYGYAEVFWSNVIHNYFDEDTPIYNLAICKGYEDEVENYRDQGTLVPSIVKKDEKLVNLLEFYRENKDEKVDIDKYINYCGVFYDYTLILESDFVSNNKEVGEELARQILYSILRADSNYHYENVSFVYENNCFKKVAKPIDHEFSLYFSAPDYPLIHRFQLDSFLKTIDTEEIGLDGFWPYLGAKKNIFKNIDYIVKHYPNVVEEFINKLDLFINDLENDRLVIPDNKDYFYPFSTFDHEWGIAKYKEHDEKREMVALEGIKPVSYDEVKNNLDNISAEIVVGSKVIRNHLVNKLNTYKNKNVFEKSK